MIEVLPVLLFVIVAGVWVYTAVVNSRLVRLFTACLPDLAREHLPGAFVLGIRNPELMLFFLRRTSDLILRQDAQVWALTIHFRRTMLLSFFVPAVGFVVVAIATYMLSTAIG